MPNVYAVAHTPVVNHCPIRVTIRNENDPSRPPSRNTNEPLPLSCLCCCLGPDFEDSCHWGGRGKHREVPTSDTGYSLAGSDSCLAHTPHSAGQLPSPKEFLEVPPQDRGLWQPSPLIAQGCEDTVGRWEFWQGQLTPAQICAPQRGREGSTCSLSIKLVHGFLKS